MDKELFDFLDDEINWDDALAAISSEESDEAKFDIITTRVQSVIREWMNTPIWAETPETPDEPMQVGIKEWDGAMQTRLGELAAVQVLGLLAMLCLKADVEIDPRIVYRNKDLILDTIGCLMVEGIMVANAPDWSDKMDVALGDVRESRPPRPVISPDPSIVKMRDGETDPIERDDSTEA
jgi:hypothetical protein